LAFGNEKRAYIKLDCNLYVEYGIN
jgi:hypothetical protein